MCHSISFFILCISSMTEAIDDKIEFNIEINLLTEDVNFSTTL